MALKIIFQPPPNYAEILAVFPHAARAGVFFCYGRAIWNPSGATISPSLMAHETVHADRQASDPDGWWKKYPVLWRKRPKRFGGALPRYLRWLWSDAP